MKFHFWNLFYLPFPLTEQNTPSSTTIDNGSVFISSPILQFSFVLVDKRYPTIQKLTM